MTFSHLQNGCLEDDRFLLGWNLFRCEVLVSRSVILLYKTWVRLYMSPKFLGGDHPARRLHTYGSITSPPRWGLIFLDPFGRKNAHPKNQSSPLHAAPSDFLASEHAVSGAKQKEKLQLQQTKRKTSTST